MTTFKPLTQNKNSNQKYNGPGFIPCNGLLPCQLDHFPAEYNQQRKEGQMAEWNGVEGSEEVEVLDLGDDMRINMYSQRSKTSPFRRK